MNIGWDDGKRVHGSLAHVDIIDGKFWIQRDGIEHGIANELLEAGIPKDRIVLAFRPPEVQTPHGIRRRVTARNSRISSKGTTIP